MQKYFSIEVIWQRQEDVFVPYCAVVGGQTWILRLNDFPEQPLFTLIIDDQEIFDFDDWPPAWQEPHE